MNEKRQKYIFQKPNSSVKLNVFVYPGIAQIQRHTGPKHILPKLQDLKKILDLYIHLIVSISALSR